MAGRGGLKASKKQVKFIQRNSWGSSNRPLARYAPRTPTGALLQQRPSCFFPVFLYQFRRVWDKLPMDGAPDGRHDQLPEKATSGSTEGTKVTKGDGEK